MPIALEVTADGIAMKVKVQAGARSNGVRGEHAGCLKISVTQAAEKGKTNAAVVAALCKALDLRPAQIRLAAGATNPCKKFLVNGISLDELRGRIAATLRSESQES